MAFSKYVITNAGRDLLLACMATGDFQISSLVLGSGSYSGIMSEITAVVTPELTFSGDGLSVVKRDNQLEVRCKLTNEQLESGFEWREYGVYATDGENTVLYCYDNAGSDPVPISAASGGTAISNTIKVILTISNDAVTNITFEPDPDMPIPDPTPSDAGKAIIVNASGQYTLGEAGVSDAVRYVAQSLTTQQQAQARANIGANPAGSVTETGTQAVSGAAVYAFAGGGIPRPVAADAGKFLRVSDAGAYALAAISSAEGATF